MRVVALAVVAACSSNNSPTDAPSRLPLDAFEFHDARPADAAPPPKTFSCLSCAPLVSGSGSGCSESIALELTCEGNYSFPSGSDRVTLVDGSGVESTLLEPLACGTSFPTFALGSGSSGTCSDADVVHFDQIQTPDSPSLDVTCTFAESCGSGSGG